MEFTDVTNNDFDEDSEERWNLQTFELKNFNKKS